MHGSCRQRRIHISQWHVLYRIHENNTVTVLMKMIRYYHITQILTSAHLRRLLHGLDLRLLRFNHSLDRLSLGQTQMCVSVGVACLVCVNTSGLQHKAAGSERT